MPEYALEGLMLKLQDFGHLMGRADSLEKTLMLGKIEGRRRREWQRMRWLDGITNSMDISLSQHPTSKEGYIQRSLGLELQSVLCGDTTLPISLCLLRNESPSLPQDLHTGCNFSLVFFSWWASFMSSHHILNISGTVMSFHHSPPGSDPAVFPGVLITCVCCFTLYCRCLPLSSSQWSRNGICSAFSCIEQLINGNYLICVCSLIT